MVQKRGSYPRILAARLLRAAAGLAFVAHAMACSDGKHADGTRSVPAAPETLGEPSVPGEFAVLGAMAGSDATADAWVTDAGDVRIDWEPSEGHESYAVTVFESDGTTVRCGPETAGAGGTSHVFAGCAFTDGSYVAEVRAVNADGETVAGNAPFAFVRDTAAPGAFAVSGITGGSDVTPDATLGNGVLATVNWSDSAGETSYSVVVLEADGTTVKCGPSSAAADSVSHSFSGCALEAGSAYKARVIALDGAGHSTVASNAPYDFTVYLAPPSAFSVSGVGAGVDTVADAWITAAGDPVVTWSDSAGETGYEVTILENDGTTVACAMRTAPANAVSLTLTGCALAEGAYKARVVAVNAGGSTPASNSLFSFTRDVTPPAAFAVSGITGGSDVTADGALDAGLIATVQWADTTGETGYEVAILESDGTTVRCAPASKAADATSHSFAGCSLTDGASYYARVRASDAVPHVTEASNSLFAFTVTPDPPTYLVLSGPSNVNAGDCVPLAAESRNPWGAASPVAAATTVNLSVNNGTGAYYSDSGCASVVTSRVIAAATSQVPVYFRSVTAPQSLTLVATATGLDPESRPMTVGSTPSALLMSGPGEIVTGGCRAFEVSRVDGLGNRIAKASTVTVNLTENGNAEFFSDPACGTAASSVTIGSWQHTAAFYARGNAVETVTLTGTDAAASLSADTLDVDVAASLTWWDPGWGRRMRLTLNNLDQAVAFADQAVLVKLNASRIDYSRVQGAGQDLRFIASDHSTVLDHEIEEWNESGTSYVWVRVPSVAASAETEIFLYYDNPGASDGQDRSGVWGSYWGVWHLSENPADPAPQFADSTAAAHDGTAENSPVSATGVISKGVSMNGNNDVIDAGTDLSAVIGYSSTFSAWLRTTQVGNNTSWLAPGITGVEQAGGGNDIFFGWIDGTGRIGVTAGNGAAAKSGFVVNDNAWRHVSITRNHVSGQVKFFVNGVLNGSGTSETGAKTTAFSDFGIIGDTGGTPTELDGTLDEIRIFNSVQSDDRIRADYKFMADTHVTYGSAESQ